MAAVADYSIVTDNPVTISAPDHHDFTVGLDSHINVGSRSVLSYMVEPAASGVKYTITIFPGTTPPATGTEVETRPLAAEIAHVRQEVIEGSVLQQPGTNTLRIEVSSGKATFSDIVLMYQSNTP